MSGRQMAAHAGCHGQRTQEARAGRAVGFCRSSNARTNATAASTRRGPRPRQRRISPRRPPLARGGYVSSRAHPGVAGQSANRNVWLRPFWCRLVCSMLEPGTTLAAKPSRMARSLGPHVHIDQQGRHAHAFNASGKIRQEKKRVKRSPAKKSQPGRRGDRTAFSCDVSIVYGRRATTQPSATATRSACF